MNRIEGDNQLIIDSPTREFADGTKEVKYYFMAKEWPQLRDNARIIIDAEKLGPTTQLQFRNTNDSQVPWTAEGCSIVPDGQVITGGISCHGLKHFKLPGDTKHPGLKSWHPDRRYATGHFGFHIMNHNRFSGHGIDVSVLDGGTIEMSGFEIQYGFSGVRINSVAIPVTVSETNINNFYIHDVYKGEPFYIGNTQKGSLPRFKKLNVYNGFIARCGAEALQFQHMIGDAEIRDIVIFAADTNWLHPFGSGQDTGIQWVCASGDNWLYNIIIDGFASNGMVPFGSDQDITNAPNGRSMVSNILFNDGRYRGMYLPNSAIYGMNWHFKDIYFRDFNNSYHLETGKPDVNHFISKRTGTDQYFFGKITTDESRAQVFENERNLQTSDIYIDPDMPAPEYVNHGFYERARRIKTWHQYYANFHPNKDFTPTYWDAGDIAIDATDDHYGFYRALAPHSANEIRPRDNAAFFMPLTWDINGVRSDQPGYQSGTFVSPMPPDDFRLKPGSYWRNKGFGVKGIQEKEQILEEYYFAGKRYTVTTSHTYIN